MSFRNATAEQKKANFTMVSPIMTLDSYLLIACRMQLQAFEWYSEGNGVHWKKLKDLVPKLAEIGITAVWIPRKSVVSFDD